MLEARPELSLDLDAIFDLGHYARRAQETSSDSAEHQATCIVGQAAIGAIISSAMERSARGRTEPTRGAIAETAVARLRHASHTMRDSDPRSIDDDLVWPSEPEGHDAPHPDADSGLSWGAAGLAHPLLPSRPEVPPRDADSPGLSWEAESPAAPPKDSAPHSEPKRSAAAWLQSEGSALARARGHASTAYADLPPPQLSDAPPAYPEPLPAGPSRYTASGRRSNLRAALSSRRGFVRFGAIALTVIALPALAAGGYLVGRGSEAAAPPATALVETAERSGVELRRPAGWTQRSGGPKIPMLEFTAPLILTSSAANSSGIVAGVVADAVGSDLLPSTLRQQLTISTPKPKPVLLGDIQALRYSGLRIRGFDDALTLYAIPTADGSIIVACHAPAGSSAEFDVCERSAATLRIEGPRAFELGPDRAYGQRVATAVAALGDVLESEGRRLRNVRSTAAQATIADELGRIFERVRGALGAATVSARDREGHDAFVAAIRACATAYDRLAAAARVGDPSRYQRAATAVRSAAGRLRQATDALSTIGYTS